LRYSKRKRNLKGRVLTLATGHQGGKHHPWGKRALGFRKKGRDSGKRGRRSRTEMTSGQNLPTPLGVLLGKEGEGSKSL